MDTRPGPDDASTSRIPPAPRVSQVDADELDEGLVGMLAEKVERSVGNFRTNLGVDLKPEISLVLKLVLFRLSFFGFGSASPGAKLQNLRVVYDHPDGRSIRAPRKTLLLYLLLHPPIFPSYILTRLRTRALSRQWPDLPSHDWRRRAWKIIVRLEEAARIWELGGWASFLWDGRYPSVLMRLLRIRHVPTSPHLQKLVSYEFMNRQLVWSAFTEFMMFSVPLLPSLPPVISPRRLFSPITSLLSQPKGIDYASIPLLPSTSRKTTPSQSHSGPLASLSLDSCPICHLRQTALPLPLDSLGAGSGISLPPISGSGQGGVTEDGANMEEERIFVPAQTDCWGGCRWCYYCIGEELYKHQERVTQTREKGAKVQGEGDQEKEEVETWSCLRCGGGVSRAWRVGAKI